MTSDTLGLKSLDVAASKYGRAVSASDFESLVKGTGTDAEAKQAVEDGINGIKLGTDAVTDAKIYYQTDANGVVDKNNVYIQGKINGKDVELKAAVSATAKTAAADGKLEFTGVAELDTADKKALADKGPLGTLDKALSKIDTQRSQLGAFQNRMQSTINNLNNSVNNLSAARSRIQDADFATEVSNMSRGQILQQAGTSVLAQANQVPQSVLSLLR